MLIALSGGADSVALLLKMLEQGEAEAAAHCNFHLRGEESDRDEQFVRQLCRERNVRLFVRHFDTFSEAERTGESLEMAARRLRYDWFSQLCREEGFSAVAVAHHRDDNAETVLLNLVRGTGLHGLTGMDASRPGVVRPLLGWSRRDILDYLAQHHQDYVTDSTNTDTAYKRNKIRHEVMPLLRSLNPQIERSLNETAQRLAEAECLYRYAVDLLSERICRRTTDGTLVMDLAKLLAAPSPRTLLHEWLSPYGFTPGQTAQALELRTGGLIETDGYVLTRTGSQLEMGRCPVRFSPVTLSVNGEPVMLPNGQCLCAEQFERTASFTIPREPHCVALDADRLTFPLTLRSVATADRFRPFGMKGTKLVSDYLTGRHRSRIDKMRACVVTDAAGIVWLVNERPDQRAAVTGDTRNILLLYTIPQ